MSVTKKCDLCDWTGDARGYAGHIRSHKSLIENQENSQENSLEISKNPIRNQETIKRGNTTMPECFECLKKDMAKTQADRDHADQLKELQAQVAAATQRATASEIAVKEVSSKWPSVDDYVSHCANCDEHKPQLENYNKSILSGFVKNSAKDSVVEMAKLKDMTLGDFLVGKDGKIKISGIPAEVAPFLKTFLNFKI